MLKLERALISVSDKKDLDILVSGLTAMGVAIISTGGTARSLKEMGFSVIPVEEVTHFPEFLQGRVKTLHPMIHGAILADRSNPLHLNELKEQGIHSINLVVVNLYPFAQKIQEEGVTLKDVIESIDIGGPTLIRGAAKNWQHVTVLTDPEDYLLLLEEIKTKGGVSQKLRIELAQKAFAHTAAYDSLIAGYFWEEGLGKKGEFPPVLNLSYSQVQELRYGENPHQKASFYKSSKVSGPSLLNACQLHGKELSFNNLNDAAAALEIVIEFQEPAAVVVKHANPCGVGLGEDEREAFLKAYQGDPLSAFGGILAFNREVQEVTAKEITSQDMFFEVIIAPGYTPLAIDLLKERWEGIRILSLDDLGAIEGLANFQIRSLPGGALLLQTPDDDIEDMNTWQIVSARDLDEKEKEDLHLAWITAKHVKSNAITLVKDKMLLGVGAGQMSRVDAMKIALMKSSQKGGVIGSDAFFPKIDAIEEAGKSGVTAIIQPGGSIADKEVIQAVDQWGMAMVFTGKRHFRH